MTAPRIALIGGGGFIGAAAERALAGRASLLTINRSGVAATADADAATADRGDPSQIARLVDGADIAIDFIAMTEADTLPLLAALSGRVGRYVLISSADVYAAFGRVLKREPGPVDQASLSEDSPLRASPYPYRGGGLRQDDYDKIPLEAAARADTRLRAAILRLPMVFGPGDPRRRFAPAHDALRANGVLEMPRLHARWRSAHLFIDDVGEAIATATLSDKTANETFNIGPDAHPTQAELMRAYAGAGGYELEIVETPEPAEPKANFAQHLVIASDKLRAATGWTPRIPLDEALARTVHADQAAD